MKRYFLFVIICFSLFGLISTSAKGYVNNKIIVLDPGHGGIDPGTIYKDVYEKDLTLQISLLLKSELEKKGYKVYLTRDGDYDLSSPNAFYRKKSDFDNRINIINKYADFYLSIHLNYLDNSNYKGIQIFSLDKYQKESAKLQNYLNKKLDSNRKNKNIPDNIYMYKRLTKPGLLIECGFISNPSERGLLVSKSYQEKLAKEIANGVSRIKF